MELLELFSYTNPDLWMSLKEFPKERSSERSSYIERG